MSIIELLQHVGAKNITLQNLADSLVRAKMKKHDGEITFATDRSVVHDMALGRCDKVGLILWIPKDKMPGESRQNDSSADTKAHYGEFYHDSK
jgi:hypothetical protein